MLLDGILAAATSPVAVSRLRADASALAAADVNPPAAVDAGIVWLLKYGMLRRVTAPGATRDEPSSANPRA